MATNDGKPKTSCFMNGLCLLGIGLMLCCLGSVFFPFPFGNQKESSKRAACISNLKQISIAVQMYESDNNDAMPRYYTFDGPEAGTHFRETLKPYLKDQWESAFLCPSIGYPPKKENGGIDTEGILGTMSYVHCFAMKGVIPDFSTGKRELKLSTVADPAKTPYIRDPIRGYGKEGLQGPHGEELTTGYLDGHVRVKKSVSPATDL